MESKPFAVTQGGLFNSHKATYSKETQQLLKVMMEESKLTTLQQKKINQTVHSGGSLPVSRPTARKEKEPIRRPKVLTGRSLRGGVRSKEMIDVMESENRQQTQFKPTPTKYIGDKGKERLQNYMAFGKDLPEATHRIPQKREPEEETDIDRFDEVVGEIEERRQFLEEMEALGRGKEYRARIATDISQKLRELEVIDQIRSAELQALLDKNDSTS